MSTSNPDSAIPPSESEPPDSNIGRPNVHESTGLNRTSADLVWKTTRRVITDRGLELLGEIASAGTAVVFDARETVDGRTAGRRLVVKVIIDPADKNMLACARREAKILSSEHVPTDVVPFLLHFHDVDDTSLPTVQPFLVMNKIDGRPLLDYVERPRPLSIRDKIEIIKEGFLAYEQLHSCNILHGDGSPNNVLVMKNHRVRLIDLGLARILRSAGTRSVSAVGGTPGYAPDGILKGEERRAVWVDINAFGSVAFHALTGRAPGKNEADLSANRTALREARVPKEIVEIIVKTLRDKDTRSETDARLYATAGDVAKDIQKYLDKRTALDWWLRRLSVGVLCAIPFLLIAAWAWWSFWTERRAESSGRIVALRKRRDALSHADHPVVKKLNEDAERISLERDEAMSRGAWVEADEKGAELITLLTRGIALREGLERCLPLRKALGEVLIRAPWARELKPIAESVKALEDENVRIAAMINRGETDAAWVELADLNSKLALLADRNVVASRLAETRGGVLRLRDALPSRLRELGETDPTFADITRNIQAGESALERGEWVEAGRLFGLARQGLETWLSGKDFPGREVELRAEIDRLTKLQRSSADEVATLQTQITKLVAQNLIDRDLARKATTDLETERAAAKGKDKSLTIAPASHPPPRGPASKQVHERSSASGAPKWHFVGVPRGCSKWEILPASIPV